MLQNLFIVQKTVDRPTEMQISGQLELQLRSGVCHQLEATAVDAQLTKVDPVPGLLANCQAWRRHRDQRRAAERRGCGEGHGTAGRPHTA